MLVPGEFNTQTNCFDVSWCMLKNQNEFLQGYAAWLEGTSKQYPDFNRTGIPKTNAQIEKLLMLVFHIYELQTCSSP